MAGLADLDRGCVLVAWNSSGVLSVKAGLHRRTMLNWPTRLQIGVESFVRSIAGYSQSCSSTSVVMW